jgi:hypothetical protein
MMINTDVVIVGAGPAGIFTALEMIKRGSKQRIVLLDKGAPIEKRSCPKSKTMQCVNCKPHCHITTGFSGAGAFSDGKLSLSCEVGGDLPSLIGEQLAQNTIEYADKIYLEFGADTHVEGLENTEEVKEIRKRAIQAGLRLVDCPIRHMGTEKAHDIYLAIEKFLEAIENATPIDKPDLPTQNDGYERFDSYTDGPVNITSSGTAMNTGSLEILEDTRGSGKVLKYVTKAGANSSLGIASTATGEKPDTYVFEWEMNITEAKASSTAVQIMMGSLYMLTIRTESDGFTLGDSSSTNGSVSVTNSFDGKYSYGKWYKLRIEYVMKDGKPTTSIYVDGDLVGTSTNFNGNLRDGGGTPSTTYNNTRFFALMSAEFTVLFDNVLCEKPKT